MGILDYFMDKGLAFDSLDEQGNKSFSIAAKARACCVKGVTRKGCARTIENKKGENALFMAAQGTR